MDVDEQVALLMQGTEYGDEQTQQTMAAELRARIIEAQKENRPLRVYCGYDPTKADLHLGHTITMRKLRQFQDLGADVTFLIGDYTSLVGDPSDKDGLRPILTSEQVAENGQTYAEQAFRVLDKSKTTIRHNSEWLSKLELKDLIDLGSNFTVQQFMARENFRNRLDRGDAVFIHELYYPIMQGFDAYMLKADVQIGGSDQLFNIVSGGRKIMQALGAKPNIAIILQILPGTDGEVKMSKSLGNHIAINTDANDMYGKLMSIPDKALAIYMRLTTSFLPKEIEAMEKQIADGSLHPRDAKMRMAKNITGLFYGNEEADKAEQAFIDLFQKHAIPTDVPEYTPASDSETLLDILLAAGLVSSRSDGRRLIDQNGVKLNGNVITSALEPLPEKGVLQAGKRKFIKIL